MCVSGIQEHQISGATQPLFRVLSRMRCANQPLCLVVVPAEIVSMLSSGAIQRGESQANEESTPRTRSNGMGYMNAHHSHDSHQMPGTLPDDVLDIITTFCREYAAFVCLVCHRFLESEGRTRTSLKRTCPVYSAFASMETVNYALEQRAFSTTVRTQSLEWTTRAKRAAIRMGDLNVVVNIYPELRLDPGIAMAHIARWDRLDIMLDSANTPVLSWVDIQVSALARRSSSRNIQSESARRLLSQVVVPALRGGSMNVISSVLRNLHRRQLSRDSVWHNMLCGTRCSTPAILAFAAMTATNTNAGIELVCQLLADATTYDIERVRRHVAAVGITAAKSNVSECAMEWAKKRSYSCSILVESVNEDISNGISIVPVRHVYLRVACEMFKPCSIGAYKFFYRETQSGGWMQSAFHKIDGYETSCIQWVVASNILNRSESELQETTTRDMAIESMVNCFSSSALYNVPDRFNLTRYMNNLSEKSVYAAYTVIRSVVQPHRSHGSSSSIPETMHYVLYGKGGVLYTLLMRAIFTGLYGVVEDLLSPISQSRGLGMSRNLSHMQHDNLMKVACHRDSTNITCALLESGYFTPTKHVAVEAASKLKSNFLGLVLDFDYTLADDDVASAAYKTRDPHTIHVALTKNCFTPGSELESSARMLFANNSQDTSTPVKKKRRLSPMMSLGRYIPNECNSRS